MTQSHQAQKRSGRRWAKSLADRPAVGPDGLNAVELRALIRATRRAASARSQPGDWPLAALPRLIAEEKR